MPDWVYYATNRNEITDAAGRETGFGPHLNPKSPVWLRYGAAAMKPATRGKTENEFVVERLHIEPEHMPDRGESAEAMVRGSDKVFETLRKEMCANRADLILLVHGFACSFENALSNAASIKKRYSTPRRPVEVAVFSWPSDGSMNPAAFKYKKDRDDARSSAKAASRALRRLIEFLEDLPQEKLCGRRIQLVAHSMGNYVLRNALQALISDFPHKTLPRILTNIFLMAADEDDDTFEHDHKLARLPELAERVNVYFAKDDRALMISDVTKFQSDRLGAGGPRTLTNLPHKVVLVDCAEVSDTTALEARHQYYRARAEVIADVQQVLADRAPEDIKPGRAWIPARRCFRLKPARSG